MTKRLLSVLSATAVGIGLLIAAPVASQAATAPMLPLSGTGGTIKPMGLCSSSATYREVIGNSHAWYGMSPIFHSINKTKVSNTATFTADASATLSASVSGTVEGGVSGAIVSAKASVTASITASVGYRVGTSTSYKIPAGKTGYAQLGTIRYSVDFRNFRYNNNCVKGNFSYGTLKAPTTVGWKTWMS